jgi:hypothetical protein
VTDADRVDVLLEVLGAALARRDELERDLRHLQRLAWRVVAALPAEELGAAATGRLRELVEELPPPDPEVMV